MRSRRVGPATFIRLIHEHRDAQSALKHLPEVARWSGVKDYAPYAFSAAEREWDAGLHAGYIPLFLGSNQYPRLLSEAPDAPPFLWARGDISLLEKPCAALVGARNASAMGRRIAAQLSKELGALGYVVVSGLARGIDTAAHQAALGTGTIAVQAGGLDVIYPRENANLTDQIGEKGLCLTEQPVGLVPQARHFPQRNRIIAGLSLGVIVTEGAARSGSLITARYAGDLGREVMAVPGNPLDGRAAGCNHLIRDGAALICSGADIDAILSRPLDQTPELEPPRDLFETPRPDKSDVAQQIISLLSHSEIEEDDIIRASGLPAPLVASQLSALELEGRITRNTGGKLALVS